MFELGNESVDSVFEPSVAQERDSAGSGDAAGHHGPIGDGDAGGRTQVSARRPLASSPLSFRGNVCVWWGVQPARGLAERPSMAVRPVKWPEAIGQGRGARKSRPTVCG